MDWLKKYLDDDDRFGASVTAAIHIVILIIALLYTIDFNTDHRSAFIEVTLGDFRSGTIAERSPVQRQEVATRPNPAEVQPNEPDPDIEQPVETPQRPVEETVKPVELPEQIEEIVDDEVVETPETEIIDPEALEVTEDVIEEVTPPLTQEDEETRQGVPESGDIRGTEGDPDVDQGIGHTDNRAAPYVLDWDGALDRSPMVQQLPTNQTNEEAVITIRFEVRPDGSLGNVIPRRKMNPELEREVMRTLRSWRFTRLPSGVPQENQWGTITFRFVLE